MKISRTGFFKNNWKCICRKTRKPEAFYPCNAEGEFERDLWGRGKFYACAGCGRMIDPKSLDIVGLMRGFRLSASEVRDLLVSLRAMDMPPLGVGYPIMVGRLTPGMYHAVWRAAPYRGIPSSRRRFERPPKSVVSFGMETGEFHKGI